MILKEQNKRITNLVIGLNHNSVTGLIFPHEMHSKVQIRTSYLKSLKKYLVVLNQKNMYFIKF